MATGTLSSAIAPLVDFVYPPRCPLCGEGIAAGPGLCAACWDTLEFPGEPACTRCQIPLTIGDVDSVYRACQSHPPSHAGVIAATIYNGPARDIVLRFKHGGRIGLAKLMARLIAGRLADAPTDAVLVPVPLHRWRLWMRGYNQAALLADAVASQTQQPVVIDALQRTRPTPKLGGLGRAARAKAIDGAIRINPRRLEKVKGQHVILVDDVLTSGATSTACTKALLGGGAKSVRLACFARVPEGSRPESETPGTITIPGAA